MRFINLSIFILDLLSMLCLILLYLSFSVLYTFCGQIPKVTYILRIGDKSQKMNSPARLIISSANFGLLADCVS